jgi:pilus assembly protein CpaE
VLFPTYIENDVDSLPIAGFSEVAFQPTAMERAGMPSNTHIPDSIAAGSLSVALIGPDLRHRKMIANEVAAWGDGRIQEFSSYPSVSEELPRILAENYDVIILELESDPQRALEIVESICLAGPTTVMVYSSSTDPGTVVRCMQAGAREYLEMPLEPGVLVDALVRASARHREARPSRKAAGRSLVFLGAKGGSGTTTLASNFAVSLAQESKEATVLIDLNLPFGDAAMELGVSSEYSTVNALQDWERLDSRLLFSFLVKHSSGLSVLAAPSKFIEFKASNEAIDKLISVARRNFDNVVVDAGSNLDLTGSALFKEASTVYLVMQFGIPELRNANRLISQLFTANGPKLEIVLNRYARGSMGNDEEQIAKALGRSADWKVPSDYAAVSEMQNSAAALMTQDSEISRVIQRMARTFCGLPEIDGKKKGFRLFR